MPILIFRPAISRLLKAAEISFSRSITFASNHPTIITTLMSHEVNALTFNLAGACIGRDSHTRNDVISRLV